MDPPLERESKRREGSANPDSKTDYQFRRRLVVCLDGTWNERDSGTNVYHLSNLILEGKIEPTDEALQAPEPTDNEDAARWIRERKETWVQMVYYDEGVGTGFLTRATGGSMGIGLSEKVRQAYDWLVERYRDGDHVFVFGFSRGAFTARSLVGLITNCGLLYRGAPLPPEQLWDGYKKMGPDVPPSAEHDLPPRKWWQPFGQPKAGPFHRLKYLKPESGPAYDNLISFDQMNETEQLLSVWSRRIPIECLAVFDTVRTLGIEALAIPWLRDRRSQFHDTRLTTRIEHGFHALAIDEHRANFSHVPWHRKTKCNTPKEQAKTATYGPIKQHWFIGAHSNIGGSYYDDTLAQWPLKWFIEECTKLNLVFKPRRPSDPDIRSKVTASECVPLWKDKKQSAKPAHICDSYTEFASGIWRYLLRSKRNYRRIAPPIEFQSGDEVQSLNEELHPSVLELVAANEQATKDRANYNPPNLYEYRQRVTVRNQEALAKDPKAKITMVGDAGPEPRHVYFDRGATVTWFLVWTFGITWSGVWIASKAGFGIWSWLVAGLPLLAWWADWLEDAITHKQALEPDGPRARKRDGMLDILLNIRIAAIALFVIGVTYFLWWIIHHVSFVWPFDEAICLIVFCVMLAHFNASKMWAALPMQEAGFGSIVALQKASAPDAVHALLARWRTGPSGYDPQRLAPVYQTIWRDMIGFIPAYFVTFMAGLWVSASLIMTRFHPSWAGAHHLGLLCLSWHCWLPALVVVMVALIADYVEDNAHLSYLNQADRPPQKKQVLFARTGTIIKNVGCCIGMAGVGVAVLWLVGLQFYRSCISIGCFVCRHVADNPPGVIPVRPAILNVGTAGLALFLAFSTIRGFFEPEKKVR